MEKCDEAFSWRQATQLKYPFPLFTCDFNRPDFRNEKTLLKQTLIQENLLGIETK